MKLLYGVTLISSLSEILFLKNCISFFLYDELKSVVTIYIFQHVRSRYINKFFLRNKVTLRYLNLLCIRMLSETYKLFWNS